MTGKASMRVVKVVRLATADSSLSAHCGTVSNWSPEKNKKINIPDTGSMQSLRRADLSI